MRIKTVLFVCKGNVHRSAIAEQLLKKLVAQSEMNGWVAVFSRGLQGFGGTPPPRFPNLRLYPEEWDASCETLAELGVSLEDHIATAISHADVARADIIFGMNEDVLADLLRFFPEAASKIHLFTNASDPTHGVPDIAGSGERGKHRETILKIRAGTAYLFNSIILERGR